MKPYRVESGTAHFQVSSSDFDNFSGQISDAIAFIHKHASDLKRVMTEVDAVGVLDFAVEWGDAAFQSNTFPASLVCEAGDLGLALEVSHYPVAAKSGDAA